MSVAAETVNALAIVANNDINVTGLGERGERPIHRSESHSCAFSAKVVVDLLRGAKIIKVLQSLDDRDALLGRAHSNTGVRSGAHSEVLTGCGRGARR